MMTSEGPCRMSEDAAEVLQHFYLELRKHSSADGSPITARQLESLVRLVEARARLELREEITKQDAQVQLSTDLILKHNFPLCSWGQISVS